VEGASTCTHAHLYPSSSPQEYIASIKDHSQIINSSMNSIFGKLLSLRQAHDKALLNYQNCCKAYFGEDSDNVFEKIFKPKDQVPDAAKIKEKNKILLDDVKASRALYLEAVESLNKEFNDHEEELR
jgi:hypothetical protein